MRAELKKKLSIILAQLLKAVASIDNSQKLLKDGDDMMYILINVILRSKVSENIEVLKGISSQAKSLSTDISIFSKFDFSQLVFTQTKHYTYSQDKYLEISHKLTL